MESTSGSSDAFPVPVLFQQLALEKSAVANEHTALREQLDRLLLAQENRDKACNDALADLRSQYDVVIDKAKGEAAKIVEDANQRASIIETKALFVDFTTKRKLDETEAAAKQTRDAATKDAELIVRSANATGKRLQDETTERCKVMERAVAKERAKWEAEKASVVDIQKFQPIVKLNVGGNRFDTSLTTLTRFPDTMIGTMFNGRHALVLDAEGYHFIDRDGTHFRYILNFLRSPETFEVNLPEAALKELQSECQYYGLYKAMFPWKAIAPFHVTNATGRKVEVEQGADGVYSINNVPVTICRSCYRGVYGPGAYGAYVDDFREAVEERKGTFHKKQPTIKSSKCTRCYASDSD